MFQLNPKDRGINVVEEPKEVIDRFSRIATKGRELADLLTTLPPNQIRELEKQSKAALKKLAPAQPIKINPMPTTVRRSASFGD